jgi:NADH dehydrogenase
VEDLSNLVVEAAIETDNITKDAVGPEIYTFKDLILEIYTAIDKHPTILHLPTRVFYLFSQLFTLYYRDILLTKNEIHGLMNNLLISHQPPLGKTSFRQWIRHNHDSLGRHYASELARHYQR